MMEFKVIRFIGFDGFASLTIVRIAMALTLENFRITLMLDLAEFARIQLSPAIL